MGDKLHMHYKRDDTESTKRDEPVTISNRTTFSSHHLHSPFHHSHRCPPSASSLPKENPW